jgi:CheY-like chemotaxis protein
MSLKIMIVDDQPANLQLLRSLAAPLGHTVLTFKDTQEAAPRAEKQRFDVVFLGMRQPELNGLALARRIRSAPPNGQAAIVILSATDDIGVLRTAFGEGADFVIPQPLTVARIRPMLAAMDSPDWKGKRHTARLPFSSAVQCTFGDHQFSLRALNISESGMLLQSARDLAVGQEVSLQFNIAEVRAHLQVRARIVRKEGTDRAGLEFLGLAPEDINAIQLYVMGRLKVPPPPREKTFGRPPIGSA